MKKTSPKTILIGSNNRHKAEELAHLVGRSTGARVICLKDLKPMREPEETGRTFEANARLKARYYSKKTGLFTLADDSGLMVHALNGRPGVYSARFAGPGCTYDDNNRKVLRLLKGKKGSSRSATFVCVVALYDAGKPVAVVRGECPGSIAEEPRGKRGFGYDPIVVPRGMKKTYAELTPDQKHRVSHRGKALQKAVKKIRTYWGKRR